MGACEQGWCGLFNIATAPQHRSKGVATAVIHTLAGWALQNGAEQLYLQVMRSNSEALPLYEKLGFKHLYSYHYRVMSSG